MAGGLSSGDCRGGKGMKWEPRRCGGFRKPLVAGPIPILTLFAFSSENWKTAVEGDSNSLSASFFVICISERQNLLQNEIRLSAFGRRDRLPPMVREALVCDGRGHTQLQTPAPAHRAGLWGSPRNRRSGPFLGMRNRAAEAEGERNYGRQHCRKLYGASVPDPDLIIRTAGEQRLSNFLLWQAAYSELYFCPRLWPDFGEEDLDGALASYRSRTRKFGALACATGTSG